MISDIKTSTPIFPIFYCGPIEYYFQLTKYEHVLFETMEHYVKQSYRSRCSIYGANGKLNLIIPLEEKGQRKPMKDIKVQQDRHWIQQHWKSLASAYRSSPFFEYYEDKFAKHYEKLPKFLIDFNLDLHEIISATMELNTTFHRTTQYEKTDLNLDKRNTFSPKNNNLTTNISNNSYIQVFSDKHGFIPNLSILDLIFNEGPNSFNYLNNLED